MNNHENKLLAFVTSLKGLTIIAVCVAALLAIYLFLSTTIKNGEPTTTQIPNTPSSGSTTQFSAYPTTNPKLITSDIYFLKNSDNKTVYININTKNQSISGVQLVLSYDPSLIPTVSITPGTFFENPVVLQNSVDATYGIISYSLSIQPNYAQIYGEGTVAILHYSGLPTGVSTMLSVLPQTKVTAKGVNTSVLKQAYSVRLP